MRYLKGKISSAPRAQAGGSHLFGKKCKKKKNNETTQVPLSAKSTFYFEFRTLNMALTQVIDGDTIYIREGTYEEETSLLQGVSGLTISAYNDETVTITQKSEAHSSAPASTTSKYRFILYKSQ